MAAAVVPLMLAGSVMSAVGSMQAAKAQSAADLYNAQQNEQNAVAATQQSDLDAARFRQQFAQQEGSMIAARGASGVTEEGSPLDALAFSRKNAYLDESLIKYKGAMRATGYYNQATLNRFSAKTAIQQGEMQAASHVLTGAGQAYSYSSAIESRMNQVPDGGSKSMLTDETPSIDKLYVG